MACGKSLIAAFLVAVTLSSMSLSLEARHLLQAEQWSTSYDLPRRSQIGKLGPQHNMYYPYYTTSTSTPIPGHTRFPMAPGPDYPPHRNGLHPIGKLGPRANMYNPASYTPRSYFPDPFPTPPTYKPFPIPSPFHYPLLPNPAKMASVPNAFMTTPYPPDTPTPGPF